MVFEGLAEKGIKHAEKLGADYAEMRMSASNTFAIKYDDGKFQTNEHYSLGFGVRVLLGGAWGFCSSPGASSTDIKSAVEKAFGIAKSLSPWGSVKISEPSCAVDEVGLDSDYTGMDVEDKMGVVRGILDKIPADSRIKQSSVNYKDVLESFLVLNSNGCRVKEDHVYYRAVARCYAKEGDALKSGAEAVGKLDPVTFEDEHYGVAKASAEMALRQLSAKKAPLGKYDIITDPELSGVLAHEAVGHMTEADLVAANNSALKGMIGERIGAECICIYDDPTTKLFGGSVYDHEGTKCKKVELVKDGTLQNYLSGLESAAELGIGLNGRAFAQDYSHVPQVRMTNTSFGAGDSSKDEMMRDMKTGILCNGCTGGTVDNVSGYFNFMCQEAFWVENGEVKYPLSDFSLAGDILDFLGKVKTLSKKIEHTTGFCGKNDQVKRNGTGGPYMLIGDVMVGGQR